MLFVFESGFAGYHSILEISFNCKTEFQLFCQNVKKGSYHTFVFRLTSFDIPVTHFYTVNKSRTIR